MSDCKHEGSATYSEWRACAECYEAVSKQELSRLRAIEEWAKDQRTRFLPNLEDLFSIRGQRDEALTTRIAIESYDAITAPEDKE